MTSRIGGCPVGPVPLTRWRKVRRATARSTTRTTRADARQTAKTRPKPKAQKYQKTTPNNDPFSSTACTEWAHPAPSAPAQTNRAKPLSAQRSWRVYALAAKAEAEPSEAAAAAANGRALRSLPSCTTRIVVPKLPAAPLPNPERPSRVCGAGAGAGAGRGIARWCSVGRTLTAHARTICSFAFSVRFLLLRFSPRVCARPRLLGTADFAFRVRCSSGCLFVCVCLSAPIGRTACCSARRRARR